MVQPLFIRNVLIFPQNPFHRAHKDLRPAHCHHREITLPIEKKGNVLFNFSSFGFRFSGFCIIASHPVLILFESMQVWVCAAAACQIRLFTGNRLFYTCRGFRSTREIFRAFYEAFIDFCKIRAFVSV